MSTLAHVALGSNLGDRLASLRRAASALADHPDLVVAAASSIWESAPAPPAEEGDPAFLNAVLRLQSRLTADDLLDLLLSIEADQGRVRPGPRTIDLDLLTFGDLVSGRPELTLPHPRMTDRAFVLRPLLEVSPDPRWAAALERLGPDGACARQATMRLGVA